MKAQFPIAALAALTISGAASADISFYTSGISQIQDDTHNANFNLLVDEQSLAGYEEDGIALNVGRDYFSWNAPGFDGSEMYYASTGALERVEVGLSSGDAFGDLELQISSGWTPNQVGTVYLWVELFNNGSSIGNFDLDTQSGEYLVITGAEFDQMLIGAYASAGLRDAHNENDRNAVAIDNISVGTYVPVPAPSTLAISATALLGLRRRRA